MNEKYRQIYNHKMTEDINDKDSNNQNSSFKVHLNKKYLSRNTNEENHAFKNRDYSKSFNSNENFNNKKGNDYVYNLAINDINKIKNNMIKEKFNK